MVSANNGDILVRNEAGNFVPATFRLMQRYRGQPLGEDLVQTKEGDEPHPVVRVTHAGIAFAAVSVHAVSVPNTAGIVDDLRRGNMNFSAVLRNRSTSSFDILSIKYSGTINMFGNCIAANEAGLILVDWQQISETLLKDNKLRILRASVKNQKFIALIPDDLQIAELPVVKEVAAEIEGAFCCASVTFHTDFEPRTFIPKDRVTILISNGKSLTEREQALADLGVSVERYTGARPTGIQLAAPAQV